MKSASWKDVAPVVEPKQLFVACANKQIGTVIAAL